MSAALCEYGPAMLRRCSPVLKDDGGAIMTMPAPGQPCLAPERLSHLAHPPSTGVQRGSIGQVGCECGCADCSSGLRSCRSSPCHEGERGVRAGPLCPKQAALLAGACDLQAEREAVQRIRPAYPSPIHRQCITVATVLPLLVVHYCGKGRNWWQNRIAVMGKLSLTPLLGHVPLWRPLLAM